MSRAKKPRALVVADRVRMRDGRGAEVILLDKLTALVHVTDEKAPPGTRYVIVPREGLVLA